MSTITAAAPAATETGSGSKLWPLYGLAAGIAGNAATMFLSATVSKEAKASGVDAVFKELSTGHIKVAIGASLGFLSIAFLVAFGVRLQRFVAARVPKESVIPQSMFIALAGGVGAMIVAFGFKAMLAGAMPGGVDVNLNTSTDVTVLQAITDQMQWLCWQGVALLMAITAYASLKYRAVPRWFGTVSVIFSAFFIVFTLFLALPYSAGIVGPVWLVVAGLGLLRTARNS